MEIKTLLGSILLIACFGCGSKEAPTIKTNADHASTRQAIIVLENAIDLRLSSLQRYVARNPDPRFDTFISELVSLDSVVNDFISRTESLKLTEDQEGLINVKRAIINSTNAPQYLKREWRDSMITAYKTMEPVTHPVYIELQLRLLETLMINSQLSRWNICGPEPVNSLVRIDSMHVLGSVDRFIHGEFNRNDSVKLISVRLNDKIIKIENCTLRTSAHTTYFILPCPVSNDSIPLKAEIQIEVAPRMAKAQRHFLLFQY